MNIYLPLNVEDYSKNFSHATNQFLYLGLPEGHYKFHFGNKLFVDQFYIKKSRHFKCPKRCNPINHIFHVIDATNTTPIYINEVTNSNNSTIHISELTLPVSFRNCLRYGQIQHEPRGLKVSLLCKVSDYVTTNCSITELDNGSGLELEINSKSLSSIAKQKTFIDKLQIDLFCHVKEFIRGRWEHFGFHQPLTIPFHQSENNSHSNEPYEIKTKFRPTANDSNEEIYNAGIKYEYILVAPILLLVALASGLIFWNNKLKKKSFKLKEHIKMDNISDINATPNLTSSSNAELLKGLSLQNMDLVLPEWLQNRKEMIYDSSCIEMGKRLGDGNFGVVFQGKIRLGNAVYVIMICKTYKM